MSLSLNRAPRTHKAHQAKLVFPKAVKLELFRGQLRAKHHWTSVKIRQEEILTMIDIMGACGDIHPGKALKEELAGKAKAHTEEAAKDSGQC